MSNRDYLYPTLTDVLELHRMAMDATGSQPQPARSLDGIESALMRAQTAAHYGGADLMGQAARMAVGLSRAQGFLDGNKRTALMVMAAFLGANGSLIPTNSLEGAQLLDALADPAVSDDAADASFEEWLRDHTASGE